MNTEDDPKDVIVAQRLMAEDFHPLGHEFNFGHVGSFIYRGQNSLDQKTFHRSEVTGRAVISFSEEYDIISTVPNGVIDEITKY